MENKYQHIFFDLDRTLWHFDENSKQVLSSIYHFFELNNHILTVDQFMNDYQQINEELWAKYRNGEIEKEELRSERFHQTLIKHKVNSFKLAEQIGDYYLEHSPLQKTLLPHTIAVLNYLKDKYQLHIITNGFEETQLIKLKHSGLTNYFNQVVFSEKVGVKKPHPLIFKQAVKSAGANFTNSIMIGDDYYADICGAQRVNMDSIYFNFYALEHPHKIDKEITCLSELYNIL